MEIVWYGLSSFRLTERGSASIVTDPYSDDYGYTLPSPRGDVITISCKDDPLRNMEKSVRGPSRVLDGPGEYEIGGVFITGVAFTNKKRRNTSANRNIVFVFDYDKVTLCHLGALNHVPNQSQIEALGEVDILLTPVGGTNLLNAAQAAEITSLIEPNLVIPIHYHTGPKKLKLPNVENFLKQMGTHLNKVETVDSLKVSKSSLPEETQIVLLTPQQ